MGPLNFQNRPIRLAEAGKSLARPWGCGEAAEGSGFVSAPCPQRACYFRSSALRLRGGKVAALKARMCALFEP